MQSHTLDADAGITKGVIMFQAIDLSQWKVAPTLNWMEAFASWLHEHDRMEKTISAYLQDLRHYSQFFQQANGCEFSPELLNVSDVKAYFAKQDADHNVAPASRNRRLASLRVMVDWAVEVGMLEYDPTVSIKRQAVELSPRDRNQDEMRRLDEVVVHGLHLMRCGEGHGWLGLRDRVMWSLFNDTGLRIHEIAGLNVEDIEFESHKIRVLGKGGKKAAITVSSALIEMLRGWLGSSTSGAVIRSWKGERLTSGQIRRRIQMIGRAAGIEDLKPHDLRHTYAYRLSAQMIEQGIPAPTALNAVRKQLRHSNEKTTLLYFRARESDIRAAVEAM